jgi:hypothetical protein
MRRLPAVLVAVHVALGAFAVKELVAPPSIAPDPVPAASVMPPEQPLDSLSLRELQTLALVEDSLMQAIEEDERNITAMTELAHLYIRHRVYEQAIGPLARAWQLEPSRQDLWYQLLLVLELAHLDLEHVDLTEQAREFAEMAAMAGHGC